MSPEQRLEIIRQIENFGANRRKTLEQLGIPESTYYHWRDMFRRNGIEGLTKEAPVAKRIWNRLLPEEEKRVVEVAKHHPELSARLLAVKITDTEGFSVSESKVFSLLKAAGLITPRPLPEMPAAKEFRRKTKAPNELWQIDGTNLFVVGWGYYKLIPVLDDYSRKVLAWDLLPDESGQSASAVVEMAVEATGIKDLSEDKRPMLLSDNGPGFSSELLAGHLAAHGIRHIFGKPYHPQTQGKVERLNRTVKSRVCLVVHTSPDSLKGSLAETFTEYNARPHEGLKNVSPNDVYDGRRDEILEARRETKRRSLERRKAYNLGRKLP